MEVVMVTNVHERRLPVSADVVGPLLDRLGTPDDVLWPAPNWPRLVLAAPLAVGVHGGHGPIRYRVSHYQPGRSAEFTFERGVGIDGYHRLEVEPTGPDTCTIRHVIRGRTTGRMRLGWPLAVRWLHDAVVEDLLDQAEIAVGSGPTRPALWSPWVRRLRAARRPRARAVEVPSTRLLRDALPRVDWSDAYAVPCGATAPSDPQTWADAFFHSPPPWVGALLLARERLVGLVGIERAGGGAFDPVDRVDNEVLLGIDQPHLGFRASVLREPDRVVLSTVVQLHNRRGRLYFALVKRVHPAVVRAGLDRAARRLTT
jgi:hypothetical protein